MRSADDGVTTEMKLEMKIELVDLLLGCVAEARAGLQGYSKKLLAVAKGRNCQSPSSYEVTREGNPVNQGWCVALQDQLHLSRRGRRGVGRHCQTLETPLH